MTNRILIVGEYGSRNGGENSFLAVMPAMIELGWEFESLTPIQTDFSNALQAAGCSTLHSFSLHDSELARKPQSTIREELADHFRRIQPSLVHCNSLSTSRLVGPVAQAMGIPSLGYLRDILKLSKTAIGDINQLDHLVAVSQATKDWHCRRGLDANKTSVIHNGVDGEIFYPHNDLSDSPTYTRSIHDELDIPTESPILLFVGQIGLRKGVDDLLTIYLHVAKSIPHAHLVIVGQRHSTKQETVDYENRLREKCQFLGATNNIHWLGQRDDVADLMRAASLLIHPARQEPLGRVLLEAASSGLPMITTDVGGTPEIITHPSHRSTLLFSPGDHQSMANSIVALLGNEPQIRSMGTELRQIAEERFSVIRCAKQLDRCYHRFLSR